MSGQRVHNARISSPHQNGQINPGGVNGCCHGWTAGVQPNQRRVLRNPRVMLIFWGHYYETSADATAFATQLVNDLVTGPFMNNLCQYGVGRGSIIGTATFDTGQLDPAPGTIDESGIKSRLRQWITSASAIPAPAVNEGSLVYFIFPPTTTELTLNGLKGDVDFCGYHNWDKYNAQSSDDDLFFGIVSTKAVAAANTNAGAFVRALSPCVGHELAESFTDRDGAGYISSECTNPDHSTQTCEIGDICEQHNFQYQRPGSVQTWNVEQYWSGWDNSCINGNAPVSIKKFLNAISFDYHHLGLRSLGTSDINLQYVASRM
jgi:hypothetical protein